MPPNPSLSSLIKECDHVFSIYIRLRDSDEHGYVTCACGCGKRVYWTRSQCSHYIVRSNMATRFNEYNCVATTEKCKYFKARNREIKKQKGL